MRILIAFEVDPETGDTRDVEVEALYYYGAPATPYSPAEHDMVDIERAWWADTKEPVGDEVLVELIANNRYYNELHARARELVRREDEE